ncbi:TrkH family potassium uptake protein [Rhodophyticola sp. CCM32]|uniref:TrkH family potassium uptake protein n=1 Tax=Rhodophyticola sp. CCM32 TaxID=2916397 RepID=UPI00107FC40E|nr:potassium transporter TrkG [Rhodophyticola sp. CCM32]QBY00278.1 TrkH family potassium uptake protein [Rhodophyticola sp. CCM32]
MRGYFSRLPLIVVLMGIGALAMLVPAAVATGMDDHFTGRVFLYSSILFLFLTGLIGFATQTMRPASSPRVHLVGLLSSYIALPLMLAFPLSEAVGNTLYINAYLEMVSSLTTTGASFFDPDRLAPAVHLWRGLVGWMGGLLIWVTAVAVLAPLNLGGYEVTSEAQVLGGVQAGSGQMQAAPPAERLRRHTLRLAPIYLMLTVLLWLGLLIAQETPLAALIHAMSTMATSGISPVGGMEGRAPGVAGEALIFLFFIFAVSRWSFASASAVQAAQRLTRDRELRLAVFAVVVLPTLLFARHWLGALEVDELANSKAALAALWGSVFTVLSFLTTTGFVSESWGMARAWSGLPTPGLILIGLVLMGGGVATTAGGVKLLRVYALYKHGTREMGKLTHPNSVAGAGRLGRRIRREGAYIAWIFFMLFVLTLAGVSTVLALAGLDFEASMVLAISALTTTGPLASVAAETPISYLGLSDLAKLILAVAMIIGRMETLVLLALINPGYWRA